MQSIVWQGELHSQDSLESSNGLQNGCPSVTLLALSAESHGKSHQASLDVTMHLKINQIQVKGHMEPSNML
jgi:hypothetical protein